MISLVFNTFILSQKRAHFTGMWLQEWVQGVYRSGYTHVKQDALVSNPLLTCSVQTELCLGANFWFCIFDHIISCPLTLPDPSVQNAFKYKDKKEEHTIVISFWNMVKGLWVKQYFQSCTLNLCQQLPSH